jgi:hypothetical protein
LSAGRALLRFGWLLRFVRLLRLTGQHGLRQRDQQGANAQPASGGNDERSLACFMGHGFIGHGFSSFGSGATGGALPSSAACYENCVNRFSLMVVNSRS